MNNFAKAGMLTIALGAVFASTDSNAALVVYGSAANAPGRCQAFTPGPSNTIRNRVVGSENIGSPIAVACDFEAGVSNTSTNVIAVDMWFSNNGTSGPINVNCTMLNGWQGAQTIRRWISPIDAKASCTCGSTERISSSIRRTPGWFSR